MTEPVRPGATTASSAAAATGAKYAVVAIVAKWTVVGAIGGALFVGTAETVRTGGPMRRPIAAIVAPAKRAAPSRIIAAAEMAAAPEQEALGDLDVEPAASAAPSSPALPTRASLAPQPEPPAPPAPAASAAPVPTRDPLILTSETALLDRIRAQLAAHRADDALALIAVYEGQFPSGVLGPEAELLKLRAMLDKGDRQGAIAVGRKWLASDPNGPYAPRIRSILGGEAP